MNNSINPEIETSWKSALSKEFSAPYFTQLKEFLVTEKKQNIIYPEGKLIFNAFNFAPFSEVKVVILGQDPYHGDGQAHGLSFSVPKGIATPPSLKNIYKEIQSDLGLSIPNHGNLESWANQGILLLNATLTVRARQAGSHQKRGWEQFTDAAIKALSTTRENLVFMLWGNFAKSKSILIDSTKHLILTAPHPSPFSAYTGFLGCKHFSKANTYLNQNAINSINWQIE